VRASKLNVRDNELASSSAAAAKAGASAGGVPASRLRVSKMPWRLLGPRVPRNFIILFYFVIFMFYS